MSKSVLDPNCYNCNHPIASDEKYCGNCGQKHHDGKYSVGEVITEFISANFNLDAKIFQTVIGLFKPGYLTTQYFNGVHQRYYKPVRLFLVLGIIVFAFLSPEVEKNSKFIETLRETQMERKYEALYDSVKVVIKSHSNDSDLISLLDSSSLIYSSKASEIGVMIDSLIPDSLKNENDDFAINIGESSVVFNGTKDSFRIGGETMSSYELLDKTPEEFVDEHFAEKKWYEKIAFTQILKLAVDGNSLVSFLSNRLPIFMLLLTPMYAFVFWLLYIRQKRYFVEHFVFVLHLNSAALILVLIFYGISKLVGNDNLALLTLPLYFGYFYLSLKKYYEQGYGKTFLKLLLINIASTFAGTIALLLIFALGILLF